jgi:putative hydrolase of the HAD superfamily
MALDLTRKDLFAPPPRALLIDAGFTLIFCDGARIAAIAGEAGVRVSAQAVRGSEPALRAEMAQHDWPQRPGSSVAATGGVRFFRRVLELAGASEEGERLEAAASLIWTRHLGDNLWSEILPGVVPALEALRTAGLRLVVVSNSEGTLERLLEAIGLAPHFDAIVDSWVVGITKPDPRIFHLALERVGVAAGEAVMVGDSLAADIGGATAAGVRAALIDPCDLYAGASAARFPSFAAFAAELLAARAGGA